MRGTLSEPTVYEDDVGIIPAYAGNTWHHEFPDLHVRDHPRVCGEHRRCRFVLFAVIGSSPRMRGTPIFEQETDGCSGIIPAYAGNTVVE